MPASLDTGGFTLAAGGDAIQMRPLSVLNDERIQPLVDRIRDADASFVNVEQVLADYDEGYPTGLPGGGGVIAPPSIADDFEWAGFNLFALANNHSNDLLHGGMFATMDHLDERGMAHAGIGTSLDDARAPAFLETPAGRVAMVAAAASPTPGSPAGRVRGDFPGRPGVNPIRTRSRYVVSNEHFEALQEVSEEMGLETVRRRRRDMDTLTDHGEGNEDEFLFLTTHADGLTGVGPIWFERGDDPRVYVEADERDVHEYIDRIESARKHSDWVIASLHVHEGTNGQMNHYPPTYNEAFARDCIDAGADAFVGHGPHQLRGIEIYEGKPIFYSLNSWSQQVGGMQRFPAEKYEGSGLGPDGLPGDYYEADFDESVESHGPYPDTYHGRFPDSTFWEAIVPVCEYSAAGDLERIEIFPVDLRQHEPIHSTGTPRLAEGERAETIVDNVREYSQPWGTEIEFEDGVGLVKLN